MNLYPRLNPRAHTNIHDNLEIYLDIIDEIIWENAEMVMINLCCNTINLTIMIIMNLIKLITSINITNKIYNKMSETHGKRSE